MPVRKISIFKIYTVHVLLSDLRSGCPLGLMGFIGSDGFGIVEQSEGEAKALHGIFDRLFGLIKLVEVLKASMDLKV
ncbi:hypothetical protein [Algoriphagus boritolerans]|uniref:hypothetical protein n=1 Tax=Algoriphagus boritolerans TaxID=308111 RepID=UPI002FCE1293